MDRPGTCGTGGKIDKSTDSTGGDTGMPAEALNRVDQWNRRDLH